MPEDATPRTPGPRCSWCGVAVEDGDGFRASEPGGVRRATFCRLEHVVPWALRGALWDPDDATEPAAAGHAAGRCAHCDQPLGEARVLLVRHRGEHRIPDGFCSVDHLTAWARAGGRFG